MKKVSELYSLSYLVEHPITSTIVLVHLEPLGVDIEQLKQVHASLVELSETNMGGGIPYEIMQQLVTELDATRTPL